MFAKIEMLSTTMQLNQFYYRDGIEHARAPLLSLRERKLKVVGGSI